jgi:hypothetical protein
MKKFINTDNKLENYCEFKCVWEDNKVTVLRVERGINFNDEFDKKNPIYMGLEEDNESMAFLMSKSDVAGLRDFLNEIIAETEE